MGEFYTLIGPKDPFYHRLESIIDMVENIPDDGECCHLNYLYARLLESRTHYENYLEYYGVKDWIAVTELHEPEEDDIMDDGSEQLCLFESETYCPGCYQPYPGCSCLYGEEDDGEED